jgi:N-acetylglucosaminyldiphosphoundecaprenol N-acetyl-beta-D-mannosaminyltransferase
MAGDDSRRVKPALEIERERILGQPVDTVDVASAVRLVLERALTGSHGAFVCLTNAHTTVESQRSKSLRAASEAAFLSVPDGMPLVWLLRRRGYERVQKVTGIEYMPLVAAAGLEHGVRHFFLGGGPGVSDAAAHGLQERVPGTQIAGTYSPPFGPVKGWALDDLHAQLQTSRPHIMWVGLGAPKQELWMASVAKDLSVPVMVGVGAAFDFLAGTKRAAPRVTSAMGLEWLFRFLTEPRRLWRRYLLGNSEFVWLLAKDVLRRDAPKRTEGEVVPGQDEKREATR